MTKFRPPDWENIKAREWDKVTRLPFKENIFEAGADAMLEVLRRNQLSPFDKTVMQANFKGKVVIIPDDE